MEAISDETLAGEESALGLPPRILYAVIVQESNGQPWAYRFEPAFYEKYLVGKTSADLGGLWPAAVSSTSERWARATSWGLMQIMGQVARELGFRGVYLTMLCTPNIGVHWGAMHLAKKIARYGSIEAGLSAYNAGKPTDANRANYVNPIVARMVA